MVVNTSGSSFNTMLGVFVGPGNSFATLTNVGAGYTTNRALDGQPQVVVSAVPQGQTNFIVIDGYGGAASENGAFEHLRGHSGRNCDDRLKISLSLQGTTRPSLSPPLAARR